MMRASAGCLVLAVLIVVACELRRPVGEACIKDSDCETDYCRGSTCRVRPSVSLAPKGGGGQHDMGGDDDAIGGGGAETYNAGGFGGGTAGVGGLSR